MKERLLETQKIERVREIKSSGKKYFRYERSLKDNGNIQMFNSEYKFDSFETV